MKKTLIAALLAASSIPAFATDYYVVVPVPNRSPTAGNIVVSLNGYSLPGGVVGRTYAGFDFNSVLQVKGDPGYSAASVRWSVVGGTLPAGLTLSSSGKLTGTPSAAASSSFQVMASYKTKAGQQGYQVVVGDVSIALAGATLPDGVQGASYFYDLKPRLTVSGDPQFTPADVTWSVRGNLPQGLLLNSDGTITGVPSAGGTSSFEVTASYLGKSGARTYDVIVGDITVGLAGATPPAGVVGQVYQGFDLKPSVTVSGDAAYKGGGAGVAWSVASGALPPGLSLDPSTGVIAGTATSSGSGPVGVKATYKTASAVQSFSVVLTDVLTQFSGYRAWSNGALAASCNEYLNPTGKFLYQGATGDGVYRIKPAGAAMDVYCDMTTDGGGWTLLMKQAKGDGVTLQGDTTYWTNGTVLNDTTANMNRNDGNLVSAAFAALPTTQLKLQASNESTLQKRTNPGSMTAKTAFSDANRTVYSDKIFTWYPSAPNWSIYATTYPNGDTLTAARFGFNFGEIWWMQQPGIIRCAVRWGWAGNQDLSEGTPGIQEGSFDACGGLGAYGVAYGSNFMSNNKNAWQPATYYLWGK